MASEEEHFFVFTEYSQFDAFIDKLLSTKDEDLSVNDITQIMNGFIVIKTKLRMKRQPGENFDDIVRVGMKLCHYYGSLREKVLNFKKTYDTYVRLWSLCFHNLLNWLHEIGPIEVSHPGAFDIILDLLIHILTNSQGKARTIMRTRHRDCLVTLWTGTGNAGNYAIQQKAYHLMQIMIKYWDFTEDIQRFISMEQFIYLKPEDFVDNERSFLKGVNKCFFPYGKVCCLNAMHISVGRELRFYPPQGEEYIMLAFDFFRKKVSASMSASYSSGIIDVQFTVLDIAYDCDDCFMAMEIRRPIQYLSDNIGPVNLANLENTLLHIKISEDNLQFLKDNINFIKNVKFRDVRQKATQTLSKFQTLRKRGIYRTVPLSEAGNVSRMVTNDQPFLIQERPNERDNAPVDDAMMVECHDEENIPEPIVTDEEEQPQATSYEPSTDVPDNREFVLSPCNVEENIREPIVTDEEEQQLIPTYEPSTDVLDERDIVLSPCNVEENIREALATYEEAQPQATSYEPSTYMWDDRVILSSPCNVERDTQEAIATYEEAQPQATSYVPSTYMSDNRVILSSPCNVELDTQEAMATYEEAQQLVPSYVPYMSDNRVILSSPCNVELDTQEAMATYEEAQQLVPSYVPSTYMSDNRVIVLSPCNAQEDIPKPMTNDDAEKEQQFLPSYEPSTCSLKSSPRVDMPIAWRRAKRSCVKSTPLTESPESTPKRKRLSRKSRPRRSHRRFSPGFALKLMSDFDNVDSTPTEVRSDPVMATSEGSVSSLVIDEDVHFSEDQASKENMGPIIQNIQIIREAPPVNKSMSNESNNSQIETNLSIEIPREAPPSMMRLSPINKRILHESNNSQIETDPFIIPREAPPSMVELSPMNNSIWHETNNSQIEMDLSIEITKEASPNMVESSPVMNNMLHELNNMDLSDHRFFSTPPSAKSFNVSTSVQNESPRPARAQCGCCNERKIQGIIEVLLGGCAMNPPGNATDLDKIISELKRLENTTKSNTKVIFKLISKLLQQVRDVRKIQFDRNDEEIDELLMRLIK